MAQLYRLNFVEANRGIFKAKLPPTIPIAWCLVSSRPRDAQRLKTWASMATNMRGIIFRVTIVEFHL